MLYSAIEFVFINKVRVGGTARTKSRGEKIWNIYGTTSGSILLHCRMLNGNRRDS